METFYPVKKSKTKFSVKYYINAEEPKQARLIPQKTIYASKNFFMIQS